ncbi:unnamed protein product [Owenia fusiformis]|uniref:Uncharacterized protein n=1 Tax=Owenia fusiformis TaxID=6347 RepID=A0A8J1XGH5_OWEFU|nr:unnamed protein product [Owenia fusiformis]
MPFRDHFRIRNFGFGYHRYEAFCQAQWQWPLAVFITYRLVVGGYVLFWLIYTASRHHLANPTQPWPVWLTNWSYFLLTCHMVLAAIIAVAHGFRNRGSYCQIPGEDSPEQESHEKEGLRSQSAPEDILGFESSGLTKSDEQSGETVVITPIESSIPWYFALDWLIYTIIANFAIIVTLSYFIFLWPLVSKYNNLDVPTIGDLNLHGINSVVIFLEICINGIPVRLLHIIYPTIYGLTYIIFSAIYWSFDPVHNVLYPKILDWNHPGTTLMFLALLAFVVIPVIQLVLFGLFKLKVFISNKLDARTRDQEITREER